MAQIFLILVLNTFDFCRILFDFQGLGYFWFWPQIFLILMLNIISILVRIMFFDLARIDLILVSNIFEFLGWNNFDFLAGNIFWFWLNLSESLSKIIALSYLCCQKGLKLSWTGTVHKNITTTQCTIQINRNILFVWFLILDTTETFLGFLFW